MPLIAGQTTTPEPEGPAARRAKRVIWIAPDGTEFPLIGEGYESLAGRTGFGVPLRELITDRMPGGAEMVTGERTGPRVMSIPLLIVAETPAEYLELYDRIVASVRHKRGGRLVPGAIRVELPDGRWRQISAYYQGGLDPDEQILDDLIGAWHMFPRLEFRAPEPTWEGREISPRRWQTSSGVPFYPIYPWRLSPSQALGSIAENVQGDADAFPIWRITGPGIPTAENETTGQSWAFDEAIPAGRTVTVDCRPPELAPETGLTAVDDLGVDSWHRFADWPELWSLEPGVNELNVSVSGATVDTVVELTYRPRHQAGW